MGVSGAEPSLRSCLARAFSSKKVSVITRTQRARQRAQFPRLSWNMGYLFCTRRQWTWLEKLPSEAIQGLPHNRRGKGTSRVIASRYSRPSFSADEGCWWTVSITKELMMTADRHVAANCSARGNHPYVCRDAIQPSSLALLHQETQGGSVDKKYTWVHSSPRLH